MVDGTLGVVEIFADPGEVLMPMMTEEKLDPFVNSTHIVANETYYSHKTIIGDGATEA
jgi:hypothetical protein